MFVQNQLPQAGARRPTGGIHGLPGIGILDRHAEDRLHAGQGNPVVGQVQGAAGFDPPAQPVPGAIREAVAAGNAGGDQEPVTRPVVVRAHQVDGEPRPPGQHEGVEQDGEVALGRDVRVGVVVVAFGQQDGRPGGQGVERCRQLFQQPGEAGEGLPGGLGPAVGVQDAEGHLVGRAVIGQVFGAGEIQPAPGHGAQAAVEEQAPQHRVDVPAVPLGRHHQGGAAELLGQRRPPAHGGHQPVAEGDQQVGPDRPDRIGAPGGVDRVQVHAQEVGGLGHVLRPEAAVVHQGGHVDPQGDGDGGGRRLELSVEQPAPQPPRVG